MSNSTRTMEEYCKGITDTVLEEHEGTGESTKLIFLKVALEELGGLTSLWGEDPDYYHDNRVQASHHSPGWEYLDIVLSEFRGQNKTIPGYKSIKELRNRFKKGERSFLQALREGAENIEESNEIRGLFEGIYENKSNIRYVRFILLTDFPCISDTTIPEEQKDGYTYRYLTYNPEKIYELNTPSASQAKLEIDLKEDFEERIPCLEVKFDNSDADYTSYLGYMKGSLLAEMYEKYNERLLEGNIRVFLQVKTAVNKGIRATLRKKDEKLRFFAYNNGISATAESVVVNTDPDGSQWIEKISGLQIVNGGQTTASIHNAKKEKVNLSGVYVQMKLTVPKNPAGLSELNPKIADYSNSQNQIKKADFTANTRYHLRLEHLSRSVQVPGNKMYWFYERIRGGYDEFCRLESFKQKDKNASDIPYDVIYPKSRRITKTDMALHYNAWNQHPYFAANGGEKNFVKFTNLLKGSNNSIPVNPDERYFHELIAMSILFIRTDTIIQEMQKTSTWGAGYKREIVLYTLSLFSYLSEGKLDLEKIWQYQETYATPRNNTKKTIILPDVIEEYILALSKEVEKHVHQPPTYKKDAREWAKTEASWKSLLNEERARHIPVPDEIKQAYYLSDSQVAERKIWLESLREVIDEEEEEANDDTSILEITEDTGEETGVKAEREDVAANDTNIPETPDEVEEDILPAAEEERPDNSVIIKYDMLGNEVARYSSEEEAAKAEKVHRISISAWVNQRLRDNRNGGFVWSLGELKNDEVAEEENDVQDVENLKETEETVSNNLPSTLEENEEIRVIRSLNLDDDDNRRIMVKVLSSNLKELGLDNKKARILSRVIVYNKLTKTLIQQTGILQSERTGINNTISDLIASGWIEEGSYINSNERKVVFYRLKLPYTKLSEILLKNANEVIGNLTNGVETVHEDYDKLTLELEKEASELQTLPEYEMLVSDLVALGITDDAAKALIFIDKSDLTIQDIRDKIGLDRNKAISFERNLYGTGWFVQSINSHYKNQTVKQYKLRKPLYDIALDYAYEKSETMIKRLEEVQAIFEVVNSYHSQEKEEIENEDGNYISEVTVKKQEADKIPVPDFRRIIVTSSYNEWVELVTKISGVYPLSDYEKTLSSITRRKASGRMVLNNDMIEIKELFHRLFDTAVRNKNTEFLELFGITQKSEKTDSAPEKQADDISVPDFKKIILNAGYNDWCTIVSKILDGYDVSGAGEKRLHAISKGKLSGPALKKDDVKAVTDLFTQLYLDAIEEGDSEYMSVFGKVFADGQKNPEDNKKTISSEKPEFPQDIYEFLRKSPYDELAKFISNLEEAYSPDKEELTLLNHILTMRKNRLIIPPEEIIRVKDIIDRYRKL